LTEGFYGDLVYRFFYAHKLSPSTFRKFIAIFGKYITTNKGKQNKRTSKYPYSKWYVKKYYKKYVAERIENKKKGTNNVKNKKTKKNENNKCENETTQKTNKITVNKQKIINVTRTKETKNTTILANKKLSKDKSKRFKRSYRIK
jgi:hypothetical protein